MIKAMRLTTTSADIFRLFEISDNQSETKGFGWASGFGLLHSPMPFFHPLELPRELRFAEVNPRPPGMVIDSGASKWPDFLGHGGGTPNYFVSEKVVEDMKSAGVPILRLTEMPVATINSKLLKDIPPPRYFVLEAAPGIEVDLAASGIPEDAEGKAVLNPLPKPWPPVLRLRRSSWNGTDLFTFSNLEIRHTHICTERVVELAKTQGWTNCRFDPIGVV